MLPEASLDRGLALEGEAEAQRGQAACRSLPGFGALSSATLRLILGAMAASGWVPSPAAAKEVPGTGY